MFMQLDPLWAFSLTLLHRRKIIISCLRLRFNVKTGSSNIIYIMLVFKQCLASHVHKAPIHPEQKIKKTCFVPFLKSVPTGDKDSHHTQSHAD